MTSNQSSECAICLNCCTHPVKLTCQHIFCFLCIKGASAQNRKCPMCRAPIADTYFDEPQLIEDIKDDQIPVYEDGYQWFYEGRNGWWLYDRTSSAEIEAAFKDKQPRCDVLIAGFVYIIDFDKMLQYRRHDPQRQRKVKREKNEPLIKGIAGLRTTISSTISTTDSQQEEACRADPIESEIVVGAEALPVAPVQGRNRSQSLQTSTTSSNLDRTRSEQTLETEIEQDLITRLQNAAINNRQDQQHRFRETYL